MQEANSNKKLIVSLKKSIDSYKHEKAVLLNLIDHLFFSEKLSLEEQSEMSRQFFNKEDLVKYQWTTLTKYNGEDFFETDAEPSLDDSEDDGEFKEYLKEEYEYEVNKVNALRQCRRDFFVLNFAKKMYELDGYLLEGESLILTCGRFIKRYTAY